MSVPNRLCCSLFVSKVKNTIPLHGIVLCLSLDMLAELCVILSGAKGQKIKAKSRYFSITWGKQLYLKPGPQAVLPITEKAALHLLRLLLSWACSAALPT